MNVEKLVAYKHRHGDAQVPKKWREDPKLGGWVAAVRRRGRDVLSPERQADLDGIFEWVSNRSCGSSFMVNFRKLREWQASDDPREMPDDLQAWLYGEAPLAALRQAPAHAEALATSTLKTYPVTKEMNKLGFQEDAAATPIKLESEKQPSVASFFAKKPAASSSAEGKRAADGAATGADGKKAKR